jgi:hypothetical protein
MTKTQLYNLARKIPEELKYTNKYTWMIDKGIIKGRFLGINDTFDMKTPLNDYIKEVGDILVIPNIVNKKITSLVVKPLDSTKKMLTFDTLKLPFGIGGFPEEFRYGDLIVFVEGIADLGALKLLLPKTPIIAMMSNAIAKSSYPFYAMLTDKIVIIPDGDKEGHSQIERMRKRFSDLGVNLGIVEQYGSMKDTGEIIDLFMEYERQGGRQLGKKDFQEKLNLLREYYQGSLSLYKS